MVKVYFMDSTGNFIEIYFFAFFMGDTELQKLTTAKPTIEKIADNLISIPHRL
jgi:hypothetical protein